MQHATVSSPDIMGMLLTVSVGIAVLVLVLALIVLTLMIAGMVAGALSSLASWATPRISRAPLLIPTLVLLVRRHEAVVFWITTALTCLLHLACETPFLAAFIIGIAGGLGSVVLVRQNGASVVATLTPAETEQERR